MTKEELLNIVRKGENKRVEFKQAIGRPERIAEEIVAFANLEGGLILFGVDDSGTVIGFDTPSATQPKGLIPSNAMRGLSGDEEFLINVARNNCEPSLLVEVDEIDVDGKSVLILSIPIGQDKPYRVKHNSKYFIRVGSTKREATREEQFRLFQASDFLKYDFFPISFTAIDDINLDKVRSFFSRIYEREYQNAIDENLLVNLEIFTRMLDTPRATVGGILLFGKEPQRFLSQSGVDLARYSGTDISHEIIDRANLDGTLDELIDQAVTFVKRNTRNSGIITGTKRRDISEYPMDVVREAITNAVAHRDYSIAGSRIRIFIFDDRLEIHSPGGLHNTINLENIAYRQYSRNRLIMEYLLKLGYVERLGTGIKLMQRRILEHCGREPEFRENDDEFIVCLRTK